VVGGERGAEAAAAVENEVSVTVGDILLDVALDDPLAEMARAREMAAPPLLLLAHVDDLDGLAERLHALDVADRHLADAGAGVVDQAEKTGRVLHDFLCTIRPDRRRANGGRSPSRNGVREGSRRAGSAPPPA